MGIQRCRLSGFGWLVGHGISVGWLVVGPFGPGGGYDFVSNSIIPNSLITWHFANPALVASAYASLNGIPVLVSGWLVSLVQIFMLYIVFSLSLLKCN